MSKISSFLQKKLITPLIDLLKQGITPEKLALTLSIGIVLACFPLLGTTTTLCVFAAYFFRLNQVAIQIANYAAYPLQIVLMIPFFRMGEKIFGVVPASLNVTEIVTLFKNDPKGAVILYGMTGLRGAVAWAIVAPFAIFIFSKIFLIFIKKMPLPKIKKPD